MNRKQAEEIINASNDRIDASIAFGNMTDGEVVKEALTVTMDRLDSMMADVDDYDPADKVAADRSRRAKVWNDIAYQLRHIDARCNDADTIYAAQRAIEILEGNA